jgi:hypothetical protein
MPQILRDIVSGELRLVEAKERRRPGVLAVVEGVFFVADKPSRNGRVYPRELWENVLSSPDLKRMLQNRLLFGTVGHVEEQLDDLIREGKVSHVVTDLKLMPDGRGWGRAEILDTPVGRVLKTLLESGSKLSVSSKAYGEYDGQTGEGYWRVSPSNFLLERFDFVVDPGFLEAQPQVKEIYESVVCISNERDVVSKLIEEKSRLEQRVVELLRELEEKDKRIKELEGKVDKFNNLRNGLLEREIEAICDLVVERFGVDVEELSADTLLGVVRKLRRVLEDRLDEVSRDLGMKLRREVGVRDEEDGVSEVEEFGGDEFSDEGGEYVEFDIDVECDVSDVREFVSDALCDELGMDVEVGDGYRYREGDELYYVGRVVNGEGDEVGIVYVVGVFKRGLGEGKVRLVSGVLKMNEQRKVMRRGVYGRKKNS